MIDGLRRDAKTIFTIVHAKIMVCKGGVSSREVEDRLSIVPSPCPYPSHTHQKVLAYLSLLRVLSSGEIRQDAQAHSIRLRLRHWNVLRLARRVQQRRQCVPVMTL